MSEVGNIFDSDQPEKVVIEHREQLELEAKAHPERCVLTDAPVLPLPFPAYAEEARRYPRAGGFEVDEEKRDANLEAWRLNQINPKYLPKDHASVVLLLLSSSQNLITSA